MSAARGVAPSTAADRLPEPAAAYAYMVRCADGSLYSGWTNDLARRMRAHRSGRGAKYTRAHGAARLAYAERCADRSAAMRREAALKKLTKAEKEQLAAQWRQQSHPRIRMATPDDAAAVVALYNWYVTHSTATFQYPTSTEQEYRENIAAVLTRAPFLVAYSPDGMLQGYACAHPWRSREAFSWDVETTIYLAPDCVGFGLGRRLYRTLLEILTAQGYYNAVALVAHPNPPSEAFHKAMGFVRCGMEPRIGYKFGRWLDLGCWVLPLNDGTGEPEPVRFAPDAEAVRAALAEGNQGM
ncbi:MAG: GNAT family N-acetyltransferase [Gemmiger sp.]